MIPRTYSRITSGIRINVRAAFIPEQSSPFQHRYAFAYEVQIVNESDLAVQLVSREWHILDAERLHQIVRGEGVVGQQPVILPGEQYVYTSGAQLRTEAGQMFGFYLMRRLSEAVTFHVEIPPFTLECPWRWN